MPNPWRKGAFLLVLLASVGFKGSWAQTTDAVCLSFFDWMSNSQHQSPCVVASSLLAVCSSGSYNVDSLPDGTHYVGPVSVFSAHDCQCNTVTYSLMSACAACQGRSYIAWSEWTANCPNVSLSFPEQLPTGLHVPGWAYLDPRPSDNFDQIRAQHNTNLTESLFPLPTTSAERTNSKSVKPASATTTRHSSTSNQSRTSSFETNSTTIPSSTNAPDSAASSSGNTHRANTIGGIAVGVAFMVLIVISAVTWFAHSRSTRRRMGMRLESPIEEKHNTQNPERAPHIIVEAPEDHSSSNNQTQHQMQRYIEATVPARSSSSLFSAFSSLSSRKTSDPPIPTAR